ncbi:hypothetical protein HAHE_16290 [Haloferula helveola]|uniref:Uncharacterized protein n=2 Tax=Haloferula helveola TaxID=490095 RepID=A0ABM7RKX7_9BACT|nr:hypothetical protein HAHE_16290 [Haloferula helveola]
MCVGALLAIPYVLHLCWVMGRAILVLDGSGAGPEVTILDHPVWSVLCAIGVALVAGGVSLGALSRKEYRKLEEGVASEDERNQPD